MNVLQVIFRRKRQDPQISGHRTAEYERNAQFLVKRFPPVEKHKHLKWRFS